MKKLTFISGIILCLLVTACSKKDSPNPTQATHSIKITASGTSAFSVVISSADSFGGAQTELKNISVATGTSFEYSTDVAAGGYVFVKFTTDVGNSLNYKIYNNGTIDDQESGLQLGTHSTSTISYQVN